MRLQRARLHAYAQAVIRTLLADGHQRGYPSPDGERQSPSDSLLGFWGEKGEESRQGRKSLFVSPRDFFRPYGACGLFEHRTHR